MKRLLALILLLSLVFSLMACDAPKTDEFEAYKEECNGILTLLSTITTDNDAVLAIWKAQEQLRNTIFDEEKTMEENKQILDDIVNRVRDEIEMLTADITHYAEDGFFREMYAVSLATNEDGGGYAVGTKLVFDLLVTDAGIKDKLNKVKNVGELFSSSTLFFLADGTAVIENHYTQLMVDAKKTFSSESETSLKRELIRGTYTIDMQPSENGQHKITVTKSDGTTVDFWFQPKGGTVSGQQLFNTELYKKTEDAIVPAKDITEYLTEAGYLKKNGFDADKADYYLDVSCAVSFTEQSQQKIAAISDSALKDALQKVTLAGDIYAESVVSFTEKGKAVITNHYTELGAKLMGLSADEPEVIIGTYTVSRAYIPGTSYYPITVTTEEGKGVTFYIDSNDGGIYRSDLFEQEAFKAFTIAELLANSGSSQGPENWTDADGTVMRDVVYGSEERNLLDVYIPANFDPNNNNGIILFIHGGSWTSGGKEDMASLCQKYTEMGYFTATMSHTYAMAARKDGSVNTFLHINQEIGQAMAKLKELSDENGWNLTQSAISGYSSGCHLSYLYAYSDGNEPNAPLPVKVMFGMVGNVDFRPAYWENVAVDGPGLAALGLGILDPNASIPEDEFDEKVDSISPLAFAKRGDAVPSVIGYALLDEMLIDWYNGVALEEALKQHDIPVELFMLCNSGHFTGNNPMLVKAFYESANAYLKTYFGY